MTGPTTVTELADELVQVRFAAEPVGATLFGFHEWDTELGDPSEAAEEALAGRLRELAAAAGRVDQAGLTEAERLTLDMAAAVAADDAELAAARRPEWQITDLFVAPAAGMLIYLPMCTLADPAQATAYLTRLAGLDRYLAAVADRHRAGLAAGRVPVARLVRAAIEQVDGYLAAPDRDPLAQPQPPAGWDGAQQWRGELDRVLAEQVRPAFRRYRDVLADPVAPAGRDDTRVGLCWLPGGEELYRRLVRVHTTSPRTPEELHETGLAQVARLAEEYAELGQRVFGSADPGEVMRRLRDDPELRCTSPEQMLADARAAVERAEAAAPRWFARLPEQRCEVRPVPEAEAARAPGAYYMPAALDGSRPGVYYQNTRDPAGQPRHMLQFAAYHEAVPGHHFQDALAQGLGDAPLLRRITQIDAYCEGWALYCERLADEMGLYTDDLARLGMLTGDSMRACRLVVDTGIHLLGWSRARTIDYLRANSPLPLTDIEVETDRYIADPGQALAYMVGRLEIERLRADAEQRLGAAFDIRRFHDALLGSGALPLVTLGGRIEAWVRGELPAAAG